MNEMAYYIMSGTKYYFNATKSELEEYKEHMKYNRERYEWEFPAERYSPDGKILYTESLFNTLKDFGFGKIVNLLGGYSCVAFNGFDASYCDGGILQIGNFGFMGTEEQYFESFSILDILQETWGYHSGLEKEIALRLADKEYETLIEDEKKLAKFMASLGIYAIIELS